ncbi:hypothetical protein DFQ28_001574 [Apophysomyces sp. BC1034]|nr:hypothetical protein DFQ30_001480 [Apophysomyces sp. BC1015]KAG0194082.1 hypothetical protein DFQ28_001574 [Apophysomyces sp. BC1034]
MNYNSYGTIDLKMEQDFWNDVIERTTNNLIDISSTIADPLQTQDIQERVEKYRELLDQLTVKSPPKDVLHNNSSPIEILLGAEPNEGIDLDWLYQSMDEIQNALDHVEVEHVGDIVVNLTLNEKPSAIRAY